MALRFVQISRKNDFIIFVDSKSVLEAFENMKLDNPSIFDLVMLHHEVAKNNLIIFCWIPSHIGIAGNEKADKAAKEALGLERSDVLIPHTDFRPNIIEYTKKLWQSEWDEKVDNKLRKIQPLVGKQQPKLSSIRDDMVIRRARIGHTYLTHKYLMVKEDQPICHACDELLTVKHVLIDCGVYQNIRNRYYTERTLKDLFKSNKNAEIIEFLKEIDLYYKF